MGDNGADARWVTERDVVEAVDLATAVDAIEAGLLAEAEGGAASMAKTHVAWGSGNTLHALGGSLVARHLVGTKTWAHTEGGAAPLLLLWDSTSGALRAVVEAFALGQLRTAAITGIATRWLAPDAAIDLAVIGSGKQALPQVAAVAAVRTLRSVRVHSPTAQHRADLAARIRHAGLAEDVAATPAVAEAVDGATVVVTVTHARQALVSSSMLRSCRLVNAVGAITPERRELDDDVARTASLVVADSPTAARELARELDDAPSIVGLSDVVAGRCRPPDSGPVLFKAMGLGLADVALGAEILARTEHRGRPLPAPVLVPPRLTRS